VGFFSYFFSAPHFPFFSVVLFVVAGGGTNTSFLGATGGYSLGFTSGSTLSIFFPKAHFCSFFSYFCTYFGYYTFFYLTSFTSFF